MALIERPHAMVGDIGRPVVLSCKGFDLTDVVDAVVEIIAESASGDVATWEDATLDVDAETITYLTEAGDLHESGIWPLVGRLTKADGSVQQTARLYFRVGKVPT